MAKLKSSEHNCDACGSPLTCASCRGRNAAKARKTTKKQRQAWGKMGGRGKKKGVDIFLDGEVVGKLGGAS